MASFNSASFSIVPSTLDTSLPDKLIHKVVRSSARNALMESRKHEVHVVDLPSKSMSMTLGGITPDGSTGKHRHNYETLIYVIQGHGFTQIDDTKVEWSAGDAVYIPVWSWHQHFNASSFDECLYIACENAPLLLSLGVALRQEA